MMNQEEVKIAEKVCIENYFKEDRDILIDESIMRIKGIMFFIYDMIYFGNKIFVSTRTLSRITLDSKATWIPVLAENCSYFINAINSDKHNNYEIITLQDIDEIKKYLSENPKTVYLLSNNKLYNKLKRMGIKDKQLKKLPYNLKVISICKNEQMKFETLGMIRRDENNHMYIDPSKNQGNTLIKVYDSEGKEKKGKLLWIEKNDVVLVKSDKTMKYSFNLYQVVSYHSRHQTVNIIWTDIDKTEKTNFYVERLEEKYKKMILENV